MNERAGRSAPALDDLEPPAFDCRSAGQAVDVLYAAGERGTDGGAACSDDLQPGVLDNSVGSNSPCLDVLIAAVIDRCGDVGA